MFEVTKQHNTVAKNTNLSGQPIICQLLSYIPRELIVFCVEQHQSDRYYKTLTTFKQLTFLFYGIITKCGSLNSLCKNLLFLEDKLMYLGINKLPAVSTLSDANINRSSEVFATLYQQLYLYYKDVLTPSLCGFLLDGLDTSKVFVFDSSTIGLFVDIFKGAGRNSITGKKKGGLKIHTKLPLSGFVPDLVYISEAACNDKSFLGQLKSEKGTIYVFDKGYVNYSQWQAWTDEGVFFVTRLNENAGYQVLEGQPNHISEWADGGVISDRIVLLNHSKYPVKARLIVFRDPESGIVLKFVSNMFGYKDTTIIQLYKYRWNIETVFKRIKQNFELGYFFSDSIEGIKTQVWIALIANLILSVIHRQCKEAEMFATLVNLASNNMTSYISLIKIVQHQRFNESERDLSKVQLELFENPERGLLRKKGKSP